MVDNDLLLSVPGFRDFYPAYWKEIQFILENMQKISKKYGYVEYEGPSLELVDLIEAKSGADLMEEIFTLTDKQDRRLLLRPEQTPTLARMLAKEQKRYKRPIRWFSIPRLFRDETAQRGRSREFWQLNVDILGVEDISVDAEMITVAIDIIRACGLKDDQYNVYINHRELLNTFIQSITDIDPAKTAKATRENLSMGLTTGERAARDLNGSDAETNRTQLKHEFGEDVPPHEEFEAAYRR